MYRLATSATILMRQNRTSEDGHNMVSKNIFIITIFYIFYFPGGDKHGGGEKGRQNFMRIGYETGNTPFYTRFSYEPYYKGHQ